jgi:CubicO group peptidase (beta-lactamase class C family)
MTTDGLSDDGLARLREVMAGHVERGAMPGLIALVARGGRAHVEVIGTKAFGDADPMPRDAIFRIASLTKPITAVAAMALVDDGTLALDAAVDRWLPELADRQVLRSLDADLDDTVPADRAITVEDLLTFRMGFGAVMVPPDTYPIQSAEAELHLSTLGPPWPPPPFGPDEWIRRFATLPLMYQPGEQWLYNTGAQVMGILVERASGLPFETFLRDRIFDPLGMADTGFSVAPDRRHRLTTAYAPDPGSGRLDVLDGADDSWWSDPPEFSNGAGWLVSTVDDYWAFVEMLVHRGIPDGRRILSEASVELMIRDRLSPSQREASRLFLGEGGSWGLGLSVPAADRAPGARAGIGWDGGTGTTWRSDLDAGLTGILFTQRAMTSPEPPEAFTDFWKAAYGALAP